MQDGSWLLVRWLLVPWLLGAVACNTSRADAESVRPVSSVGRSTSAPAPSASQARPPCPSEMALVDSSCIDRYEAHLVLADRPEVTWPPYLRPLAEEKYRARSLPGVLPQGYVSRREAAAACARAEKRLCTAREWQAACKGPHGYLYPYGTEETKGRCNTGKPHLPQKLFGPDVMTNTESNFNSPLLAQEPGFLAKAGEYAGCVGEYGVFDLVGNLHEWVADDVNDALLKKIPIPYGPGGMGRPGNGVFMGGFFSSGREHGRGCEYVTTHHAPGYHDYSTGFRCCRDALPR